MKIKNKKISISLEKSELLRFLARHLILSLLLVFYLSFFTALVIINNYYPLIQEKNKQSGQIYFDENIYNFVLKDWKAQEQKIQELNSKQELNLFYENTGAEKK